jgi:hypothetical protein
VNLKSQEGQEVLRRLVREHDVLLESFRPGVLDRLGVGYEVLRQVVAGPTARSPAIMVGSRPSRLRQPARTHSDEPAGRLVIVGGREPIRHRSESLQVVGVD